MKTKTDVASTGSPHRHWDSRNQWTKKTETHTHDIDLTTLTQADIDLLKVKLGITAGTVPTAPTNLKATAGNKYVDLSWMQ